MSKKPKAADVIQPFKVTDERDTYRVVIRYRVKGFWTDTVRVYKGAVRSELRLWRAAEVVYSLGGEDASDLRPFERTENFIAALQDAVRRAKELDVQFPVGSSVRPETKP